MKLKLKKNMTILFQGDSITDCYRGEFGCGEMGDGYALLASSQILTEYSELGINFINRGVSGDCIEDLRCRWEQDCLHIKPDIVSILVGINDVWQRHEGISRKSSEPFFSIYRDILQQTRDACDPQFIICEPFLLHVSESVFPLRDDLNKKIEFSKKLSEEFDAVYVPFDTMFQKASQRAEPAFWAPDGVHPTSAGHALMAKEWVACVLSE